MGFITMFPPLFGRICFGFFFPTIDFKQIQIMCVQFYGWDAKEAISVRFS